MQIDFKDGVLPDKLKAITFRALFAVARVYERKGFHFVVTSTTENAPGRLPNSYHYHGQAFDCRIYRIPKAFLESLCNDMREALHEIDECFQVVLKPDHIHVELDRSLL